MTIINCNVSNFILVTWENIHIIPMTILVVEWEVFEMLCFYTSKIKNLIRMFCKSLCTPRVSISNVYTPRNGGGINPC